MKKIIGFFIALHVCIMLSAQVKTRIHGSIQDAKTKESIPGVIVKIKGSAQGAVTNYEGIFSFETNEKLPLVLQLNYLGYQTLEYTVKDSRIPLSISMVENTKQLKEIEIRDSRITERQKQNPITVETMDALAIRETPAANFYEGLAHLKGVDMTSASIGFKVINTRGFNSTSPVRSLQLIDGVDNQSPGLNFSLGNFLGASDLDVQKVDLVVGASSAYYGPNAFNGVINMITKDPYQHQGISVQAKTGERNLKEFAVRVAKAFKNKDGRESFAYKINAYYMQATDWYANSTDATIQSPVPQGNPGGYDAVNRYGDEYINNRYHQTGPIYIGFGYIARTGYNETDLVDYSSRNFKSNAGLYYRFKNKTEINALSSFATGTTVYQGDNRFRLKDILFFQNKLEWKKEGKFYLRAYATNEDAGKTYDIYNTALLMQNKVMSDNNWAQYYQENWNHYAYNTMMNLFQNYIYPSMTPEQKNSPNVLDIANQIMLQQYADTLNKYHQIVRAYTDTSISPLYRNFARLLPGSDAFNAAFDTITSKTNREGGSRFFDQSALYHIAGAYQFKWKEIQFNSGANFRLYAPFSKGTIFLDTAASQRIYNWEMGYFLGMEKALTDELKVSFTNRLDKNQNFQWLWSPAATIVYAKNENVFRMSISSAIRNPTLADQYINLNVGRATLLGNLHGFDSLVTIESLITAFNTNKSALNYFNIAPIRPERVKTIEIGYRNTFHQKAFIDLSMYFSQYTDFIGYKIGAQVDWQSVFPDRIQVYRVATNSIDIVYTYGFSAGLNYFINRYLGITSNYSWNKLDRNGSTDPLIPAFNTPEHKYNIGVNGRNLSNHIFGFALMDWGYSINWKWQQGFRYEGSPQFTGDVPSYGMMDIQWNKSFNEHKWMLKIGASNVLNNMVYQVYGGPRIGRMFYASINFDLH